MCHGTSLQTVLELSAIDSLMWQRPDSALMRLLPYFDTCRDVSRNVSENGNNNLSGDVSRNVSENEDNNMSGDVSGNVSTATAYDRHYAHLLLAELLYKNDYGQTNRKDLLKAVDYFDSLCCRRDAARHVSTAPAIAFLDARAHYINGVGYYENDSVVEACKEYMKALEVMEGHFGEKNWAGHKMKFMALIYTRLTDLFSGFYLHKQAIYFGKMSLEFHQKSESSPRHIAWMLNKIGSQYEMIEDLDSASQYYLRGLKYLPDTNNLTYRDLSTHLAFLSFEKGGDPQLSLRQICTLLNQAETHKEYCSRCLTIGEIYYNQMNYDSALVYLNVVFSEAKNTSLKKQAAEWLIEICKAKGREDEILQYADFLVPFANQEENQSATKSQMTELYKSFSQNRSERLHQQVRKKNLKWAFLIGGGLLAVTLTIAIFLHRNKKRNQHLETQIKEEKYAHVIQQKALSERLKRTNEELREALKRIEEQGAENVSVESMVQNHISGHQRYEVFMQTPICQEVLNRVRQLHDNKRKTLKTDMDVADYRAFALTPTQLASLSKAVSDHFPELYASLKKRHPAMNQKDWKFCLLYLMQLDKLSICILLQESYHTCRRYTMKLEHAFNCQYDLSVFLIEQAILL